MDSARLLSAPKSEETADFRGGEETIRPEIDRFKAGKNFDAFFFRCLVVLFSLFGGRFCGGCKLYIDFLTIDFKMIQ